MNALNYRPSIRTRLVAWATFLIFLVGAAWLGAEHPDGFGWTLVHDSAQVISAAALALAGVSSILEWHARKRWKSAIQVIAVDLLSSLVRDTGGIMSKAAEILLSDAETVHQLDYAFQLPWTRRSEQRVEELKVKSTQRAHKIADDQKETADSREMVERLQASSEELRMRSDRLRDAATALDAYVRGDHLMPLLAQTGWLHRRVHILCDYADNAVGIPPARTAQATVEVLDAGLNIAKAINDPVAVIRRDVKDPRLKKELDENEWAIDETQAIAKFVEAAKDADRARERVEDALGSVTQRLQHMHETSKKLDELREQRESE